MMIDMAEDIEFRRDRFIEALRDLGYADLSQEELAAEYRARTGRPMHQTTVSGLLRGTRKPSREALGQWASFLGTSVDYLLGVTDDPRPPSDMEDQVVVPVFDHRRRAQLQDLTQTLAQMSEVDFALIQGFVRRLAELNPTRKAVRRQPFQPDEALRREQLQTDILALLDRIGLSAGAEFRAELAEELTAAIIDPTAFDVPDRLEILRQLAQQMMNRRQGDNGSMIKAGT